MFIACRLRDISDPPLETASAIFYKLIILLKNSETFTSVMHCISVFLSTKNSLHKALGAKYILTCIIFSVLPLFGLFLSAGGSS